MTALDVKSISYEPAAHFKFRFGILPEKKRPDEDRNIEELLGRVEKKIGRAITDILEMK